MWLFAGDSIKEELRGVVGQQEEIIMVSSCQHSQACTAVPEMTCVKESFVSSPRA